MITTSNAKFATLTQNLRDHAFSSERHFWHKFLGYNYRMTNIQAAVGLAQTEQMSGFVEDRRPPIQRAPTSEAASLLGGRRRACTSQLRTTSGTAREGPRLA
jgi:dTDP-4-amino-4,6-dideoxygalactose transaminase